MGSESGGKPHVGFLPSPGMGHVTPLYELALRLATQHHFQATFLVIPNASTIAEVNYLSHNPHPDIHILHLPLADMSDLLLDDMTPAVRISVTVDRSIRPLPSVLAGLKLKALVIDVFCTGVFDACKDLAIPVYSFFTASAALLAFSLYLPTLDRQVEGEFVDLQEPVQVPGCSPTRTQDLMDPVRNRKIDEYKVWLLHVSRLSRATGIFVNTWEELEPVALKAVRYNRFFLNIPTPPVYPIGPLTKQVEPVLSEGIITWLDKQPKESVLFVALGSGGTLTSEQLTELAWGLELSQQRFVLVVRKPSNCAISALFRAGTDPDDPKAYLPEGFLERTSGVGLVVSSWAPQVAVLNHRSTGAFLSHCGWNSTVESIKCGVPMIVWPMYAEQRMNATQLKNEVGVAVKMPVVGEKGEITLVGRMEIARVVKAVMEDEEGKKLRKKAKELEGSGRETLGLDGSSYQTLARLAESWKET